MRMLIRWIVLMGIPVVLSLSAMGLTADEILERVEEQGFLGFGTGHLQGRFSLALHEPGEDPTEYRFRVWGREEDDGTVKTTILYAYPELVEGTVFLFHTPPEEEARLWLYLPALNVVKELVGQGAREGEFIAGSGISYDEIAHGFVYRDGYESELVGEATLDELPCWQLQVTPEEPDEAEWSLITLWVHQDTYVVVRAEFRDADGEVVRYMTASELEEDELGIIPRLLTVEDAVEGTRAVVRIAERSQEEIPDEVFIPEHLHELVP